MSIGQMQKQAKGGFFEISSITKFYSMRTKDKFFFPMRLVIKTFKGVCSWVSLGVSPMADKQGWVLSPHQPPLCDPPSL